MLDKTGLFSIDHRGAFSFNFEVQIAIQQAVSKVTMLGAYIRKVYTYYCTSGSHLKNPLDPGITSVFGGRVLAVIGTSLFHLGPVKCYE